MGMVKQVIKGDRTMKTTAIAFGDYIERVNILIHGMVKDHIEYSKYLQ